MLPAQPLPVDVGVNEYGVNEKVGAGVNEKVGAGVNEKVGAGVNEKVGAGVKEKVGVNEYGVKLKFLQVMSTADS